MGDPVDQARRDFAEHLADVAVASGMPRMPSRALGALLASEHGRLTAAELAEALQASPAAISGAMRYLEQIGMARRTRDPGSRRDHFEVFDHALFLSYRRGVEQALAWARVFDEGARALGEQTPAGRRLTENRDLFAYLADEMPKVVDRWYERRGGTPPP